MLEKSLGLLFFLKQSKIEKNESQYVYLRITVDGISKEISTKHLWNASGGVLGPAGQSAIRKM